MVAANSAVNAPMNAMMGMGDRNSGTPAAAWSKGKMRRIRYTPADTMVAA